MSYLYLKMLEDKTFLELLQEYINQIEEEDYFTDSDSDYEPDSDEN